MRRRNQLESVRPINIKKTRFPYQNPSVAATLILVLLVFTSGQSYIRTPIHNQAPNVSGATHAEIPNRSATRSLKNTSVGEEVNVYAVRSAEPAPMGIVDYGIGPNGPYQYSSSSFWGVAVINSLVTGNASGYPWMSFQLNVNLVFTSQTNQQYTYWIQDVAQVNTQKDAIFFLDNVWNYSSNTATIVNSGISGNGVVADCNCSTNNSYYYYWAPTSLPGNAIYYSLPLTIQLAVASGLSSSNQPEVIFQYNDGSGWQTYDTVIFPEITNPLIDNGFLVDGSNYNPWGLFDDSELIMGGVSSGANTSASQSQVDLHLMYWNGYNYQEILNAYNFGSDTAEGISNVVSQGYELFANGSMLAEVTHGSGTLGPLYTQSDIATVNIESTLSSGTLYIVNESYTSVKGVGYDFTGNEVNITTYPGTFELYIYNSQGTLVAQGTETLSAGQNLALRVYSNSLVSAVGIPLAIYYSVLGGGSSYSAPTFTYVSNGVAHSLTLSTTPTTVSADSGSSWSVTSLLSGSNSTERWITNQATRGIANSAETMKFAYNNQYEVVLGTNPPADGSTNPSGSSWYNSGQSYTISATAINPYFLTSWTSTSGLTIADPYSSSTTVLIGDSGVVTANFGELSLALNTQSGEVTQGSSILLTGLARGEGSATISVSGLSSGETLSQASNSVSLTPTGTEFSLTIGTSHSAATGTITVTVTLAESAIGSISVQYTLSVRQAVSMSFAYSVVGSYSGFSAPVLSYTYNGTSSQQTLTSSTSVIYVDQNTPWSINSALSGSTVNERWETNQTATGIATSTMAKNFLYYHQYLVSFRYSVNDSVSRFMPPKVNAVQFGSAFSPGFGQQVWVDASSQYTYTDPLPGSTSGERWYAVNSSATVLSSGAISIAYIHQFYLNFAANPKDAGSVTLSNGWYNAGGNVSLSISSNSGWQFENWIGQGNYSYTGLTVAPFLIISSPVNETASFYVGVTVTSSSGGSASYSDGSIVGTVKAGSSETIYVPPSSRFDVSAAPSSFLYQFNKWSGASTSTTLSTALTPSTPSTVVADFGYNIPVIGLGSAVIVVIAVAALYFALLRRRTP